jgi:hypothetical protein
MRRRFRMRRRRRRRRRRRCEKGIKRNISINLHCVLFQTFWPQVH